MRLVLCDDNAAEREYFSDLTKEIANKNDIFIDLDIYENARQMLFALEGEFDKIDVFLLDINMPELSGIEAARKIRDAGYKGEIVFLTVSKEHMLGAFDVRAFHYVVKGETDHSRVEMILESVIKLCYEKSKEYMLFTGIGEYRNVAIASIKYFEVQGKIVTVHYGADKRFEFVSTMGKLENLLFSKGFIRVHRSFLVASSAIENYSFKDVVLKDGTIIPLGRRYYNDIKKVLLLAFMTFGLLGTAFGQGKVYGQEARYRISIVTAPGEHSEGLRQYINEDTGEVHYEIIEATGHIWSEWIVEQEADYGKPGRMYRVCTKYPDKPHYEYREIPALEAEAPTQPAKNPEEDASEGEASAEEPTREREENSPDPTETPENEKDDVEQGVLSAGAAESTGAHTGEVLAGKAVYNPVLVAVADAALITASIGFAAWFVIILWPMILVLFWIRRKKKEAKDRMKQVGQ